MAISPPPSAHSAGVATFGSVTVPSSAGLVADVQAWVNSPATNFGWFVIGNEAAQGNALRFDTHESGVGTQPTLSIDFSARRDRLHVEDRRGRQLVRRQQLGRHRAQRG